MLLDVEEADDFEDPTKGILEINTDDDDDGSKASTDQNISDDDDYATKNDVTDTQDMQARYVHFFSVKCCDFFMLAMSSLAILKNFVNINDGLFVCVFSSVSTSTSSVTVVGEAVPMSSMDRAVPTKSTQARYVYIVQSVSMCCECMFFPRHN